ncbi:MAG: trypsin-like serine protease, partial [Myxococcota bacterium]|nr:trypsin-like serine protease [Myxococcota bacterium]
MGTLAVTTCAGLALALCSVAVAASGCAAEVASSAEPIVAGEASADETVVAVVPRRVLCEETPTAVCSGVLIAPSIVLTAAHCIENARFRGDLEVFFGAVIGGEGTYVVVSAFEVDPAYDPTTGEHDLALMALADVAPVSPHVLTAGSIDEVAPGAALRVVGYGTSGPREDDGGERRSGAMTLTEVREASFDASPSPGLSCQGDSGGPVFADVGGSEVLVGMTVRGDSACRERAMHVRIDAVLETFIRPTTLELEALGPAWPTTAIALDDLASTDCASDDDCPALMRCGTDASGAPRCALLGL